MSQFEVLPTETIQSGDGTDAYFDRLVETLEHAGRNPPVIAEVIADQFPTGESELLAVDFDP